MKRSRFELGLTVETLVSGNVWDAKRESVTGAGRLREWFPYAATSGARVKRPLMGACQAH